MIFTVIAFSVSSIVSPFTLVVIILDFIRSIVMLTACKLNIVLISLWGLMHKIYPTSRYQNVSSLSFWDQYYNIAPYFYATKCD